MFLKKHKKILLLILVLVLSINSYSQTTDQNLLKYWRYRDRLKYFVVPDNKTTSYVEGESYVASIRNIYGSDVLKWGQQTVYTGRYLGVLATEYKLLYDNGQYNDAENTALELKNALLQWIEISDKSESLEPWFLTDNYDGFFIRDYTNPDILALGSQSEQLLNMDLTPIDVVSAMPPGKPAYVSKVESEHPESYTCADPDNCYTKTRQEVGYDATGKCMSKDECCGLLLGLALVKRCCANGSSTAQDCEDMAKTIADKVVKYIANLAAWTSGNCWEIFQPNGIRVSNNNGGYPFTESWGFAKSASWITGNPIGDYWWFNYTITKDPLEYSRRLAWHVHQSQLTSSNGDWMGSILAAIGDSWCLSAPSVIYNPLQTNISTTAAGLYYKGSVYHWDSFYLLLYEVLHNISVSSIYNHDNTALTQLNNAPCNGPYYLDIDGDGVNEGSFAGGWASSGKFWHHSNEQNYGDDGFSGNYNGLDYMLLYNLYHIQNSSTSSYVNYVDRKTDKSVPYLNVIYKGTINHPYNVVGFNTIESEMEILGTQNSPAPPPLTGYVTHRAGKEITLKPGFYVENGAYFRGYIEPFECDDNDNIPTAKRKNPNLVDNESLIISDIEKSIENYKQKEEYIEKMDAIYQIQCYPNPISENSKIEFSMGKNSHIKISIFSIEGLKIKELVNGDYKKGKHTIKLNRNDFPSPGFYFCSMETVEYTKNIKLVIK